MRTIVKTVAALSLFAAAGCVSSSKYEQKEKEAVSNDQRAQAAEKAAKDCQAKAAGLEKDLAAMTQSRDELQAKAASLGEQKAAAEAKSAQYEKLASQLHSQIEAGQVEISELRGRMMVKLADTILFPSGSAKLSKEAAKSLGPIADVFKDLSGKNVIVGGYTDNVPVVGGQFKDNWELSTARAISVVRFLAGKGVPPGMLGAAGFSEYRPVAPNDSKADRAKNRRIEIALTAADNQPPVTQAR